MVKENFWLDDVIFKALKLRKNVRIFLCRDKEGGFGIKVDGKEIIRNLPTECFEIEMR